MDQLLVRSIRIARGIGVRLRSLRQQEVVRSSDARGRIPKTDRDSRTKDRGDRVRRRGDKYLSRNQVMLDVAFRDFAGDRVSEIFWQRCRIEGWHTEFRIAAIVFLSEEH